MLQQNKNAVVGTNHDGIESNLNFTFGGKYQGFDVFDNTEKPEKIQCDKCNPPTVKSKGKVQLCAECRSEQNETAELLLANFQRHCKIIKLDCFCFSCEKPKTAAMMAKRFPICRKCADELKGKGAVAARNFINRAVNNFHKGIREVAK